MRTEKVRVAQEKRVIGGPASSLPQFFPPATDRRLGKSRPVQFRPLAFPPLLAQGLTLPCVRMLFCERGRLGESRHLSANRS